MPHTDELNEMQKKAVTHKDGPLCVIAGAGAGKTRVITHRINELIKGGIAPKHILAVTFTNKAAREMRERIFGSPRSDLSLRSDLGDWPFVSTFHSLGVHILRARGEVIGVPRRFTIFDRSDSLKAIKNAMGKSGQDPKQYEPRAILSRISRQKGDAVSCDAYETRAENGSDHVARVASQVWREYDVILKNEKALDFDDLLLKTYELLKNNEAVRTHYQDTWHYIHIDEYQDTNRVQCAIANILAEKHKNICVVGDMDQNIYSFRGADIRNMLSFEKTYPDVKTIFLEENYRSTQVILRASNMVIEKNKNRIEKTLFTRGALGEFITLMPALSEAEEAYAIATRAKTLIEGSVTPRDIAVLYRTNFQSRALEEAFLSKNIPYQVIGVRFFERKEVRDVLAFLRLAVCGETAADLARVINVPPRGIGKITLLKILEGKENKLTGAIKERVIHFRKLLADIHAAARAKKPSETISYIGKFSGLEEKLRGEGEEGGERLLNIKELAALACRYDALSPEEGVLKLLEDAALESDADEMEESKNAVRLMTVHASKGLEFDTVFITGLEDGLFPHVRNNGDSTDKEEERRLFYVAMTRAKKKVFLSYAHTRTIFGLQSVNVPSEFLSDIDESLIEMESPVESAMKTIFLE